MRRGTALLVLFTFMICSPVSAGQPLKMCAPAVLSEIHISQETAGYSIDIKYPVLCVPKASRTIRDYVTNSLSAFKMYFPEHDLTAYRHKHQMITEYEVWVAGRGRLASVKLQEMVYTGGAHPNNWPVTWVFDMTDGRVLDLDDIFISKRDALIELAQIVREVLAKTLGDMHVSEMLDSGTGPTVKNYDDFILNEDGVVFFFAPYQVAPYAAGQQVVTIPYARLDELLKPEIKIILK